MNRTFTEAWRAVTCSGWPIAPRLVVLVVADHVNAEKGIAWPSMKTIADHTGLDRRSVIRWLKWLEERGVITSVARYDGAGDRTSNAYQVHLDRIERLGGGDTVSLPGDSTSLPGVVTGCHQGWGHGVTTGGDTVSPNLPTGTDLEDRPIKARAPRAPGGGGKSKSAKAQKQKAPRKDAATPEEHRARGEVIGAFRTAFKDVHGAEPYADEGKTAVEALRLVRRTCGNGPPVSGPAIALIENAFRNPYTRGSASLAKIAADPDRYRGTGAPVKHTVQPSTGAAWTPNFLTDDGDAAA